MHRKTAQWFGAAPTTQEGAILLPECIVPLPPMPRGRPRVQDWSPGLRLPKPLPEDRPAPTPPETEHPEFADHWWFAPPSGGSRLQ